MNTTKIINLMGPTACGKTDIALALAERYPVNIISVDSALIYRHMDIGTAKPGLSIRQSIPHYLIDIIEPDASYSVGHFVHDALEAIQATLAQKRIPMLVGGTMMYFKGLYHGLANLPVADPGIRAYISTLITRWGWEHVYTLLKRIDPLGTAHIHRNDPQRIQRGLEVYYMTGKPLSYYWAETQSILPNGLSPITIGLYPSDRARLHERIAGRFDAMLKEGFIDEVDQLMKHPNVHADRPSMRAVGYRQAWQYLSGEFDYSTMREKGIAATRQLAKRQITWLKSWPNLDYCLDPLGHSRIAETIERWIFP